MSTFKNWKHQLQHHLHCLATAAAFLMLIFTPDFPNLYFKACVVNGRLCLVYECKDSLARYVNLFGKRSLSLLGSGAMWGEGRCSCWDHTISQSYTCVMSVTEMAVTMPFLVTWIQPWEQNLHGLGWQDGTVLTQCSKDSKPLYQSGVAVLVGHTWHFKSLIWMFGLI